MHFLCFILAAVVGKKRKWNIINPKQQKNPKIYTVIVIYCADDLSSIKSVLLYLDENTEMSIKNAVALFENRNIKNDVAY